jgi:hypothetical protein
MDEKITNDFTGLNYYGGTIPGNVLPMTAMPFGFSLALARNNVDGMGKNMMTETEKEHLIMQCKDAASDEEAEKILQKLEPDVSAQLLQEEATVYGPLENTNAF